MVRGVERCVEVYVPSYVCRQHPRQFDGEDGPQRGQPSVDEGAGDG